MNLQYKPFSNNVLYPLNKETTAEKPLTNFLKVAFNKGIYIIRFSEIVYLKSESSYTMIYLENGKKILSSNTLKCYEELLPANEFIRVHRSFIIPLSKVEVIYNSPSKVQVKGNLIPVSKNSIRNLKSFFC